MKTCLWPGDEDGIDIEISKKEKKNYDVFSCSLNVI